MDLSALLGGAAPAAPAPAAQPTGLEALLGGAAEAAPAQPEFATPAFLQPQAAAAPAQEDTSAGAEQAMIAKLLGSSLVELDQDLNMEKASKM